MQSHQKGLWGGASKEALRGPESAQQQPFFKREVIQVSQGEIVRWQRDWQGGQGMYT